MADRKRRLDKVPGKRSGFVGMMAVQRKREEKKMKICVCGKGGSGKSTLVALLTMAFKRRGKQVIVLDSDESNTSLYWLLGLDGPPRPLMDMVGGKKAVQQRMLARFSKGEEEPEMSIWAMEHLPSSQIPNDYVAAGPNCKLVVTGKIHQALEGCACPMGAVTREFLKILKLAPDEVALVDMEAGIEHFGRGVEASVDAVVAVVEPSLESIALARKVMDLTRAAGAVFNGAVLNKIPADGQGEAVRSRLRELSVPVIGVVDYQPEIQAAGLKGGPCPEAAGIEIDRIVAAFLLDDAVVRA
jgi:CO dehydrogenase maturation factor